MCQKRTSKVWLGWSLFTNIPLNFQQSYNISTGFKDCFDLILIVLFFRKKSNSFHFKTIQGLHWLCPFPASAPNHFPFYPCENPSCCMQWMDPAWSLITKSQLPVSMHQTCDLEPWTHSIGTYWRCFQTENTPAIACLEPNWPLFWPNWPPCFGGVDILFYGSNLPNCEPFRFVWVFIGLEGLKQRSTYHNKEVHFWWKKSCTSW